MKAWTGVVLLALALTGRAGETFGPGVRVSGVSAEAMAVDAEGDRLYVAAGTRLSVLDISRPLEPIVLGELECVDNRRQLVVRNGFVYLVSRETGLRIVDCSDPRRAALYDFSDVEHPKLLRNWTLAGNPDAAAFCGTRVLIPAGHQGLLMTRSAASADCATFCYNIRQPSQGE